MEQWIETDFKLSNGTEFSVCHNMPEVLGLSIQDAFENWIVRTGIYTVESFIKYIHSKDTGCKAMTREKFDKLNN